MTLIIPRSDMTNIDQTQNFFFQDNFGIESAELDSHIYYLEAVSVGSVLGKSKSMATFSR